MDLKLLSKEFTDKHPALKALRDKLTATNTQLEKVLRQIDEQREQLRAMQQTAVKVEERVTAVEEGLAVEVKKTSQLSAPGFQNYINNGDFSFSQEGYNTSTYTNDENDAAEWYTRASTTTTQIVENTTTVQSASSLRNNVRTANNAVMTASDQTLQASLTFTAGDVGAYVIVAGAGPGGAPLITTIASFTDATHVELTTAATTAVTNVRVDLLPVPGVWVKVLGIGFLGTSYSLYSPLVKNICQPGNTLYCRMQVFNDSSFGSVNATYGLQVSLWDNTSGQQKVIEGAVWDVSATPQVASPGTFTRRYILQVDSTAGIFYSDVLTPAEVTNQVSVSSIDNVNYVTIQWPGFPEATSYTLFRFDTEFNEWRQIALITNGAIQFQDKGGRSGALFTPPGANINVKARAIVRNFKDFLNPYGLTDFLFAIRIPTTYNYGATTNKQWLRVDVVDADGNYLTSTTAFIHIDKIAFGYNNGTWTMSVKDQTNPSNPVVTTPLPTEVPGGNDQLPSGGEGAWVPEWRGNPNIQTPNSQI